MPRAARQPAAQRCIAVPPRGPGSTLGPCLPTAPQVAGVANSTNPLLTVFDGAAGQEALMAVAKQQVQLAQTSIYHDITPGSNFAALQVRTRGWAGGARPGGGAGRGRSERLAAPCLPQATRRPRTALPLPPPTRPPARTPTLLSRWWACRASRC